MKLTISYNLEPLVTTGHLTPIDYTETKAPDLYIDDKPVPKALADIIMLGINVASEQYLDMINELRKQDILV
jgi:hypothetical protein